MNRTAQIRLAAALLAVLVALTPVTAVAADDDSALRPVEQEDLIFLSLMFRNQLPPYLERQDADPRVAEIGEQSGDWRRTQGDTLERFRLLAEAYNRMTWGGWDEGRQVATVLDLRLRAKLYEPGQHLVAELGSLWERPERFSHHFLAKLSVVGADGSEVVAAKPLHLHEAPPPGEAKRFEADLPPDLAPGRYTARYELVPHMHDDSNPDPVLSGERSFFVVPQLEERLAKLEGLLSDLGEASTPAGKLIRSTLRWYLDIYRRGQREDVPGAYAGHPIFMTAGLQQSGFTGERMRFADELELAEKLADLAGAGRESLQGLVGDMRLAYRSPVDDELVPFRIFVPSGMGWQQKHPLVVALHGAGGDENSFMDRYQELFKSEAQKHGYLALSVNGRGPYSGYRGAAASDVIDATDLITEVYPVDASRVYLMGHSMGGMGTVAVGFDNAERFAALAPIAGFGAASQLDKATGMPIFVAQGEADALVPVAAARSFHEAAKEREMEVEYVELPEIDHIVIVDKVMARIFDFFDEHKGN